MTWALFIHYLPSNRPKSLFLLSVDALFVSSLRLAFPNKIVLLFFFDPAGEVDFREKASLLVKEKRLLAADLGMDFDELAAKGSDYEIKRLRDIESGMYDAKD